MWEQGMAPLQHDQSLMIVTVCVCVFMNVF